MSLIQWIAVCVLTVIANFGIAILLARWLFGRRKDREQ